MSADGVDPAARGIAIGLDLGGSSVKFAVLGLQGGERPELLSSGLHEIPASRAPDVVVEILATTGNRLCEQFGAPERIGVGLPGLHDPEDGTTRLLPNFPPEWVGFPLRTELEARLPWPVVLGNDARAFALAEATMGAAVGFRTAVCIVLGTGVGGGVVIDGELWRGQGTGGELGHQTVELDGPPCGCGNRGCVEAIAGSAALLRGAGRSSVREVFEVAPRDPVAAAAITRAVRAIGAGLANSYAVLAPEVFVVGGGIADAGDQLLVPLHDEIRRRMRIAPAEAIRVRPAQLGRLAGAIGAALLSRGG